MAVEDLQTLIDGYGDAFELIEDGKIRCKLTFHELPYRIDEFKKYVQSKKFVRAYEIQKFLDTYGEYFDDIGKNLYGCKLTMKTIAKDQKSLNAHVVGIKFKNALKKHQEKLLAAAEEPENAGGDASKKTEQPDQEMPSEEEVASEEEEEVEEKPVKKVKFAAKTREVGGKFKNQSGTKRNSAKKARKS